MNQVIPKKKTTKLRKTGTCPWVAFVEQIPTFFPQGTHPSRWTDDGGYSHIFMFSASEWETKLGVYLRVRILA